MNRRSLSFVLALLLVFDAPAQTVSTWTAPTPSSVFWSNTSAWSTAPFFPQNGQPAAADTYHAVIGRVAGQTAGPRVDLNRVLTLNRLDFSDGIIRGIVATPLRQITVNGPFNWTGGTLDEIAATVANGGMTIGQLAGAAPTRISGHVLTNAAGQTATHAAQATGTLQFADTSEILQDPGTFQNNGTFLATGGAGGMDDLTPGTVAQNKFVNAGTFRGQSVGTYAVDVFFENTGAVSVDSGSLALVRGGTSTGGSCNVAADATLVFMEQHTLDTATSFTGAGTIEFGRQSAALPPGVTIAGAYNFPGLTRVNAGKLIFTGSAATAELTVISGSVNLPPAATLTVNGPLVLLDGSLNGGRIVASEGSAIGGSSSFGSSEFTNPAGRTARIEGPASLASNGRVVNAGTFEFVDSGRVVIGGGATGTGFTNTGTVLRTSGTGTAEIRTPLTTSGTVGVQTGIMEISLNTSAGGTFNVAAGATLVLRGGTADAATVFAGAGTVEFEDVSVAGNFAMPATMVEFGSSTFGGGFTTGTFSHLGSTAAFNGTANITALTSNVSTLTGTLTFNGSATIGSLSQSSSRSIINFNGPVTIGNLSQSGGSSIIAFNVSTTINSPVTKSGGTLNVAPGKTLTLAAPLSVNAGLFGGGGTVLAAGGLTLPLGHVELAGATTMLNPAGQTAVHAGGANGDLILTNGSIFDNRGTYLAQNNRLIDTFNTGTGQNFFRNSGTFTRDTATGTYTVESDFENTGTVNVTTGRLTFASTSAFTQNSGTFRLNGGAVTKSGGAMRFNGGTLTGAGTITGAVDMQGGTLAPGNGIGTLIITSNVTLSAGATVGVEIGGTTQGTGHDFLSKTGGSALTLAGNLSVTMANGFQNSITPAQTFTVLTSNSNLAGAFANVASGARLQTADGLGSFIVTYAGTRNVVLSSYQANPVAPPNGRITAFSVTPTQATLTWAPFGTGTTYQVQTSTILSTAASWTPLGPPVTGTTTTVTHPGGPRRFFRVIVP